MSEVTEADKDKKVEPVFLKEGNIFEWDVPGQHVVKLAAGSTTLIEFLGVQEMDDVYGDYRVIASATRFVANIERIKGFMDDEALPKNREVLFEGGITIYSHGTIPGTEIVGYNLVQNGRIWAARKELSVFGSPSGLRKLIIPDASDEQLVEERIGAIIAGYETQRKQREEGQSRASHESFKQGRATGERNPGYRSGCC